MCEFKVIIDGKIMFDDAVYAKSDNNNVIVKDILGKSKDFKNCRIAEVDVKTEQLILATLEVKDFHNL